MEAVKQAFCHMLNYDLFSNKFISISMCFNIFNLIISQFKFRFLRHSNVHPYLKQNPAFNKIVSLFGENVIIRSVDCVVIRSVDRLI